MKVEIMKLDSMFIIKIDGRVIKNVIEYKISNDSDGMPELMIKIKPDCNVTQIKLVTEATTKQLQQ